MGSEDHVAKVFYWEYKKSGHIEAAAECPPKLKIPQ